jgi:hypothetical protein
VRPSPARQCDMYPEHEKTYKSFVKGGTIFASTATTIIALMAIFLT